MPTNAHDQTLIDACVRGDPLAWRQFLDRFGGLIQQVIVYSAQLQSVPLQADEVEDHVAEVFERVLADNCRCLRKFHGRSTLATYLAVVGRRVALRKIRNKAKIFRRQTRLVAEPIDHRSLPELDLQTREEVIRLLSHLDRTEANVVRGYYLEQKSYREISQDLGIPTNSIGPVLARARDRLRAHHRGD